MAGPTDAAPPRSGTPLVRPARADDRQALARLLGRLGYPVTPEALARRLERLRSDRHALLLVAEADGVVAGLAALHIVPLLESDRPLGRLTAIVVEPRARRAGVGRTLVGAVESAARSAGCDRLEVTSGADRATAHGFYLALGFKDAPRRFVKPIG